MIKELLIGAAVAHITVAIAVGVQRRKWRAKDAVVDAIRVKLLDALHAVAHVHIPVVA